MARVRVHYEDRELHSGLREYKRHVDEMLGVIMDYYAARGVAKMKADAPWTDRTGAARAGLFTVVEHPGQGHYTIVYSHSVHYGFWLEVKFSGRDAVVRPTILKEGRALMEDLRRYF